MRNLAAHDRPIERKLTPVRATPAGFTVRLEV